MEELDVLLSTFLEDGTPLVILGDFNIHLDQGWATGGPRAVYGPQCLLVQPGRI